MTSSVAALPKVAPIALLAHARSGSREALGQILEACRGYLLAVASRELPPPLQSKVDAADVVQDTFIEATRDFVHFHGESEQQLLGWLRGILRHNLTDLNRHYDMNCRSLSQEVCLLDELVDCLRGGATHGNRATICEQLIAQEQCRALEKAVQRLPTSYRQVLQLRYGERCHFAEIGERLQRSSEAVRKMVCRALERLRKDMCLHGEE